MGIRIKLIHIDFALNNYHDSVHRINPTSQSAQWNMPSRSHKIILLLYSTYRIQLSRMILESKDDCRGPARVKLQGKAQSSYD